MSCADWWTYGGAAPLHATRMDPAAANDGARIAVVSAALGAPFLPWQRYTCTVATERLPDGRYRYPIVVVTVPRQSGKTTLLRALGVDRCLFRAGTGVFYTAQTGKDARERWQDLVKAIKSSAMATLTLVRSAAGSERVIFPNGSYFRCFAPLPKNMHGYTPPLVLLDEAFSHDRQTGDDLMGAIGPAQITVADRQLWIVSTAGTAESVFLRQWVEAGRAGEPGVALFEWAAAPELPDIYDPASWPSFHPAMHVQPSGLQLVTEDALRQEATRLSRSEFERAYGNRWTRTRSHLIPGDAWDPLADGEQRPPDTTQRCWYGFDVMPDRSSAALVAAWRDEAGHAHARTVRSGPGDTWLLEAIEQLHSWGWRRFTYADDGPAREIATELLRRRAADGRRLGGLELVGVGGRDYADAWGHLLRAIRDRTFRHDGSSPLAVAAGNVATRPLMDTAAPSRKASAGDITPLVALMLALDQLERGTAPAPSLSYRFGA